LQKVISVPRTRYLNKKSLAETLALFVDGLAIRQRDAEQVRVEDSLDRVTVVSGIWWKKKKASSSGQSNP